MQKSALSGSYRFGDMIVRVLQGMFPKRHSELKGRDGHNTLVLPVVFRSRLTLFYNESGYFLADPHLFSHDTQN